MKDIFPIKKKYLLLFILIPVLYLPAYISDDYLLILTQEDGLYENVGALLFFFTAIAFFVLTAKPYLFVKPDGTKTIQEKWFFLLFGLLFLFACGEEISWGQRILNFSTPEAMEETNMQGEFNIHNLEFFHGKNAEGEDKTGILALLEMHRLFYMTFFSYLLVFPLLYKKILPFKKFIDKIYLPVPSVYLGILFTFNLIYGHILKMLISNNNVDIGHSVVEIKETVFAIILFMLPLSWMDYKSSKNPVQEGTPTGNSSVKNIIH